MRKKTAVAGSAGFLLIAPGVVAGVVPWWLTRWQPGAAFPVPVRFTGGLLTAAGSAALIGSFAQFALEGRGTPAPPAPTEQLVVHGLYRHVRNPMYLAVLAVITGQALLSGRPVLLGYAAAVGGAFTASITGRAATRWRSRTTRERCRGCPAQATKRRQHSCDVLLPRANLANVRRRSRTSGPLARCAATRHCGKRSKSSRERFVSPPDRGIG